MSFETEREALTTYLQSNWNEGTLCAVKYENQDFTQPQNAPFAEFEIIGGDSAQASMGGESNLYRTVGVIVLSVYLTAGSGTKKGREIGDAFAALFRNKILSTTDGNTITFKVPKLNTVGAHAGRYKLVMSCSYRRDELLSS